MGWSATMAQAYNSTRQQIFALNGTYTKRIEHSAVYEWGIAAPTERPTLSVVTASDSGITGTYNAKYTYARKERSTVVCESNASDAARATAAPSGEDLRVTFTEPDDDQVNCIRIYRTENGGATYYYDSEMNWGTGDYATTYQWEVDDEYETGKAFIWTIADTVNNIEAAHAWEPYYDEADIDDELTKKTCYADNTESYLDTDTADSALSTALHTDHNPPPAGAYVVGPTFDGILFVAKDGDLYFCKSKQPEYWPATYYVRVSPPQHPGKCMVLWSQEPYYLSLTGIYRIYRSSDTSYVPMRIPAKTGTQSQNGALAVEGYGIFHVGSDGLYLCVPSTDYKAGSDRRVSSVLDPIFRGEAKNGMPAAGDLSTSWLALYKGKLYFAYPSAEETYPGNLIVFDLENMRLAYFSYGIELHHAAVDYTNSYLMAGDENGYVWHIEDTTKVDDGGTDIDWELQSKDFTLSTRAHFPRWVKYDIDASHAESATGYLLLDGATHQTHTLSADRSTKRRLVAAGNGERCALKVSGSGVVRIHAIESE